VRYIGSEVTDTNNILSVDYVEWGEKYQKVKNDDGTTTLKASWEPVHFFSTPRVAMVAVVSLLNKGYKMKVMKP
jgi:hypothetical protein